MSQAGKPCLSDWEQSQQLNCVLTDMRFQRWNDLNIPRSALFKFSTILLFCICPNLQLFVDSSLYFPQCTAN